MCGIVGITNPGRPIEAAVERLRHRGPDAQRTFRDEHVALGFTRLSIIDLSERAHQPMASRDEQVQLVFNGEIYSFEALRKQLETRGHVFRTRSDSEVLLCAYLEWGEHCFERLDGMFAACVYDRRRRRLVLARDRVGIKPLYYFWDGRELAFASELSGLEALLPSDRLNLDETALYDVLTYRYVPCPKSIYREIRKLPAASRMSFDLAGGRLEGPTRYWSLGVDADPPPIEPAVAAERLRARIDESVAEQWVADVPVGCLLSGGLDSSAVVAAAARGRAALRTYSIGFEDPARDETRHARRVSALFGTEHREVLYAAEELGADFAALARWYGEPFADASAFPTHRVCALAREDVTVALSGDGGDELFGGYRWYESYPALWRWGAGRLGIGAIGRAADRTRTHLRSGSLTARAAGALALFASDPFDLRTKLVAGLAGGQKDRWLDTLEIPRDYDDVWALRRHWRPELPLRTRLQVLDFHTYLPDDILTKVDRVSMRHGLEVRVPLLANRLVDFAFAIPESVRFHGGALKGLLRLALRDVLPPEVLERGKQGFSVPRGYADRGDGGAASVQERVLMELWGVVPLAPLAAGRA